MAVRTTFLWGVRAWLAGPGPRPPQPIKPTRRVSVFSLAKSDPGKIAGAASTLPTSADALRNSRREVRLLQGVFIIQVLHGHSDRNLRPSKPPNSEVEPKVNCRSQSAPHESVLPLLVSISK